MRAGAELSRVPPAALPVRRALERPRLAIAYIRRRYGVRINILARTYGLTRRTIFRILREQRTKS
jgi:hypothetical protein